MSGEGDAALEIYGMRSCRYTAELQSDLDWDGHSYATYYVDEDGTALERLSALVDEPFMVPVLVENGEVRQVGYRGRGCYVRTDVRGD